MEVTVKYEIRNIAPRFSKAIWRKYEVGRIFPSVKEAKKSYNLRNCCYELCSSTGEIVRVVNNARIDSYGRRMS